MSIVKTFSYHFSYWVWPPGEPKVHTIVWCYRMKADRRILIDNRTYAFPLLNDHPTAPVFVGCHSQSCTATGLVAAVSPKGLDERTIYNR